MPQAEKIEAVNELHGVFKTMAIVVVAQYAGLSAPQMSDLRNRARQVGAVVKVAKNRLAKIAVKNTAYAQMDSLLKGQNIFAYASDPIGVAKVVVAFAKANEKFLIVGGHIGVTALEARDVQKLAKLPSLDETRATIIGLLDAPAGKLARVLGAPMLHLRRVVRAHADTGLTSPWALTRSPSGPWPAHSAIDSLLTPSILVVKLSSRNVVERTKGIREASIFLASQKGDSGADNLPEPADQLSRVERFEASTLPARLYARLFSSDEFEAREAAYALVANAAGYRGKFDPSVSPLNLSDAQQEQFRSALVGFLEAAKLHYFSHVAAVACDPFDAEHIRVHLKVSITRKVPFQIGGQYVLLRDRKIRSKTLHIDCPWAESIDAIPTGETSATDDGLVAAGDAFVVLHKNHAQDNKFPVVLSFNQAIETVDVTLPA